MKVHPAPLAVIFRTKLARYVLMLLVSFSAAATSIAAEAWQEPVDASWADDVLLVVDRAASRVRHIDPATGDVRDSLHIDGAPSRAVPCGAKQWWVLDRERRGMHRLDASSGRFVVAEFVALEFAPREAAIDQTRRWLCVSGGWSEKIQCWRRETDGSEGNRWVAQPALECPFASGCVIAVGPSRFVVSDAINGRLALVDASANRVIALGRIAGHQIRDLAYDSETETLWLVHQQLSRLARTSFDDLHWGNLMQNALSAVALGKLVAADDAPLAYRHSLQLGDVGDGFADPSGLVRWKNSWVIASGGTNRLLLRRPRSEVRWEAPAAVTRMCLAAGRYLIVVAGRDGRVDSFDLRERRADERPLWSHVAAHAPRSAGERLFYDAHLSHDGWLSCNSCHVDGQGANALVDTRGDGGWGAPKRIPPLFHLAATAPYGWLGNQPTLGDQLDQTLASTMHGETLSEVDRQALLGYLRALRGPGEPTLAAGANDRGASREALVRRGRALFQSSGCVECHRPPAWTSHATFDVGIVDASGNRRFNPPSLIGVRFRTSLLHDGRATSLRDLIEGERHQVPADMDADERAALRAFLRSL